MPFAHRRQDCPPRFMLCLLQMCVYRASADAKSARLLRCSYWPQGRCIGPNSALSTPLKFCPVCVYKNLLHDTTAVGILLVAFSRTVSCKNLQPPFWGATAPAWWPL